MQTSAKLWYWPEAPVESEHGPSTSDRGRDPRLAGGLGQATARTSHDRVCPTCKDPLQGEFGTHCPRCQWSEHDPNLDRDPLSNPSDPFVDLNLGITPKTGAWEDDLDRIPGARRVAPIPNREITYSVGDRVTRQYANPAPRSTYGLPGAGHICPNTGTVVDTREPGEHYVYGDDPEGGFGVIHEVPSYDVQWDLGATPDFTSYFEPGRTGEAIPQYELWPEGHENVFKSLVSPKAPDAPPEHWGSRVILSHRHKWFAAVEDL